MNSKVPAPESLKSDRIYRMNKITRDKFAVYHFSNLSWCRLNPVNLVNPVRLDPMTISNQIHQRRCLAASYSKTPVATETLRLSTGSRIGMRTA